MRIYRRVRGGSTPYCGGCKQRRVEGIRFFLVLGDATRFNDCTICPACGTGAGYIAPNMQRWNDFYIVMFPDGEVRLLLKEKLAPIGKQGSA